MGAKRRPISEPFTIEPERSDGSTNSVNVVKSIVLVVFYRVESKEDKIYTSLYSHK